MMRRQCAKTIGVLFALLAFALPVNAAVNNLDYKKVTAISIAIESIELEGRKDFFLPPGTDGQLVATTSILMRIWKAQGALGNCRPERATLRLNLNPGTGLLVVAAQQRAWMDHGPGFGRGVPATGAAHRHRLRVPGRIRALRQHCGRWRRVFNIGSVDVRLSLGKVAGGRSAGDLFLCAEEPLAILSTPEAMVINSSSDQVTPIYRDGLLEQIITPQAIVNVIRYSPLKYEVHFYDFSFRGKKLEDGAYSLDPTAVPMARVAHRKSG